MSEKNRDLDDAKANEPGFAVEQADSATAPDEKKDSKSQNIPAAQAPLLSEAATLHPAGVNPDIHRLVWVLLRGWWIILIVLAISIVYAGYSLTTYSPLYTSHMVVREMGKDSDRFSLPSAVTGLAAGLGVRMSTKKIMPFDEFRILLNSERLARELDRSHSYVDAIYGGQWNEEKQTWNLPTGWRVDLDNYFRKFAPIAEWTPPSTQQLAQYIAGSILISDVQGKDVRAWRIQYRHPDREFALQFLRNVFHTAENMLYSQELERVSKTVKYVKERLVNVTISEYRESLIFVMAQQEKRLLELQSGKSYVAQIIQPPIVTHQPSSPNVLVRLILGAIVGLGLGVVLVLLVGFLRSVLSRRP